MILIVILIGLIISTKPNLIYTYAKSTINEQKNFCSATINDDFENDSIIITLTKEDVLTIWQLCQQNQQ